MDRRTFVFTAASAVLASPHGAWAVPRADVTQVLRGAQVYDGTGAPPVEADVALGRAKTG